MSKFTEILELYFSTNRASTRLQKLSTWNQWVRFMKSDAKIGNADVSDVYRYLHVVRQGKGFKSNLDGNEDISSATIKGKLYTMRGIYRFLLQMKKVKTNPFDSPEFIAIGKKKSPPKRETKLIPFHKVREIIDMPSSATKEGIRDRGILASLFCGGVRQGELRNLRVRDVRQSDKGVTYLFITNTKNGKDRYQTIPDWAQGYIQAAAKIRVLESAQPTDRLFVTYEGVRQVVANNLCSVWVWRFFRRYMIEAGLGEEYFPHCARATAITKLLEQGIPHSRVKDFAGHQSIQMTESYYKLLLGVDENAGQLIDYAVKK